MKTKKWIWLIPAILLLLLIAGFAFGESLWTEIGRRDANAANERADGTLLATIQGEEFRSNGFETMLGDYALLGNEKDPEEYARKQVFQELLLREAESRGFSVDEAAVKQHVKQTKAAMEQSPEAKATLREYLRGLGMKEKEYWEISETVYRKWLLTSQLDAALRQEYFAENPNATDDDFHDYYMNEYRDSLFESYQVQMLPLEADSTPEQP